MTGLKQDEDTIRLIREFITDELVLDELDDEIGPDQDLLTSGLIDSLGVMRLVGFIQDEFAVQVPPEDVTIDNFLSLATISTYVTKSGSGSDSAPVQN